LVKRRTVCAWLGLVLILANVVLGLALGPQPMTVVTGQAGESVVICSVHGAFTVKTDDIPVHDQDSQDHGMCPCCLPLAWGDAAALAAAAPPLPLPPSSRAIALVWSATNAPAPLPDKSSRARAPPSAA